MTSETKRFIDLLDIKSIRLKCGSCGCSLLIDLEREGGPGDNLILSHNHTLSKCPTCGHPWTENRTGDPAGWDSEIKGFLRAMRVLKQVQSKFGCVLELEIAHMEQL